MRRPRRVAQLSAIGTFVALAACGTDAVTSTPSRAPQPAPSAQHHAPPGATVVRYESGGRAFWVHWTATLDRTFTIGLVTRPSDLSFCGGTVRPAVVDGTWTTQLVRGPGGTIHLLSRLTEPATIVLYEGLMGPGGLCGLADQRVLATGTVWMDRQTDNDLRGTAAGANVWGRHLVGEVVLASGERARLVIVQRFVMRPNDPADEPLGVITERILLQPIGG